MDAGKPPFLRMTKQHGVEQSRCAETTVDSVEQKEERARKDSRICQRSSLSLLLHHRTADQPSPLCKLWSASITSVWLMA